MWVRGKSDNMNREEIAKIAGEARAALEAWDKKYKEQKKTQYTTRLWNTHTLYILKKILREGCL
ncbi:MAG: hypothetical protein K0R78_2973 [Pelosinus sp.]|nr:hypothetical protein [Pelosinus sp.]